MADGGGKRNRQGGSGNRDDLLLEQAAGNAMDWRTVPMVLDIIGLEQLVHDAALGDVKGKKTILDKARTGDEPAVLNLMAVDGVIFTQGAPIHPAVGKNKKVVRAVVVEDVV